MSDTGSILTCDKCGQPVRPLPPYTTVPTDFAWYCEPCQHYGPERDPPACLIHRLVGCTEPGCQGFLDAMWHDLERNKLARQSIDPHPP